MTKSNVSIESTKDILQFEKRNEKSVTTHVWNGRDVKLGCVHASGYLKRRLLSKQLYNPLLKMKRKRLE